MPLQRKDGKWEESHLKQSLLLSCENVTCVVFLRHNITIVRILFPLRIQTFNESI